MRTSPSAAPAAPHSAPSAPAAHGPAAHAATVAVRAESRRPSWVELSVALTALVVSVASLFVARHQAQVMDRQLAASVWPLVEYGTSNTGSDGSVRVTLGIGNSGVGPTRIRSFRLTYDGRPVGDARALLLACCMRDSAGARATLLRTITSPVQGRVITPGDEITFLKLPRDSNRLRVYEAFDRERFKVDVRTCYCSVLNDCWVMTSADERADPAPVTSCAEEQRAKQYR